jgi:cation transport regulator ChaC
MVITTIKGKVYIELSRRFAILLIFGLPFFLAVGFTVGAVYSIPQNYWALQVEALRNREILIELKKEQEKVNRFAQILRTGNCGVGGP